MFRSYWKVNVVTERGKQTFRELVFSTDSATVTPLVKASIACRIMGTSGRYLLVPQLLQLIWIYDRFNNFMTSNKNRIHNRYIVSNKQNQLVVKLMYKISYIQAYGLQRVLSSSKLQRLYFIKLIDYVTSKFLEVMRHFDNQSFVICQHSPR